MKFILNIVKPAITLFLFVFCFSLQADRGEEISKVLSDKKLSYREKSEQIYKLTESIKEEEAAVLIKYCDSLLEKNDKSTQAYIKHIKITKAFAMKRTKLILEGVNFLKTIQHDTDLYLNNVIDFHIARGYLAMSDYNNALGYFLKNLKFYSKNPKYVVEKITTLKHVSNCYRRNKNFKKNYQYLQEAIAEAKKLGDIKILYSCYSVLALYYLDSNQLEKADSVYTSLLEYNGFVGLEKISLLNNLAEVRLQRNDIVSAEKFLEECLKLTVAEKDTFWMGVALAGQGAVYTKKGQFERALKVCEQAYRIAKRRKSLIWQKNTCECLFDNNLKLKNYKAALENYRDLIIFRDSITNEKNTREITRKELQFEYDKKEAEVKTIAKAEKEKAELKAEEDKKRSNLIIWSVIAGLLLVSVFSVFIYRSLQQNKNANKIITAQKDLVEVKQKEILDSITYARRIQQSLLPSDKYIERNVSKLKKK